MWRSKIEKVRDMFVRVKFTENSFEILDGAR